MRQILLVEDDEDLRELFAEILRDAGYTVDEARNGQVALDHLVGKAEPCLMLLDLMMPVMSGPELLATLEHEGRCGSLPVIVLSAGGAASDVPRANKFLRKPVSPEQLLEVVGEYCGDHHA
jgi:CheY-like chemotaxis protein